MEGYLTRPASDERPLDDLVTEMLERPLSRRTLLARGRDLGLTVAATSFLSACGSAVAVHRLTGQPEASAIPPKYLVMVIIDAGRPDYLDYTRLPNIEKLRRRGTYYDRAWVGQLESVTPASHATIGSGCFPSSNGGILGFWWTDPATGSTFNSVDLTGGSDPDSISVIMADAGTPTMAEFLKRHDSRAKVYTASGQKFYAADAVGGSYADYISYYHMNAQGAWGPTCIPGHDLPAHFLNNPAMSTPHWQDSIENLGLHDALVGDLAIDVIRSELPRIVILNLPEMDWPVAHDYGGPESPTAVVKLMRTADDIVGKLIAEYKAAGIYEETVFMVLGDHGVTPLQRFVDRYAVKTAVETIDTVTTFDSHTGWFGWLENSSLGQQAAAAVENSGSVGISTAVYYQSEKNGRKTYLPGPNTAQATPHNLHKAFQYLLQTVNGDNAPHVVCLYPERTGTLDSGLGSGSNTPWKGDHGGASWGAQAVPLIISGPGVKANHVSHFPARLADLAPTAMRLLGVPYPRTDGIVLADAMTAGSKQDAGRQNAAAQYLVPYAGAIRRWSAREAAGLPALHHLAPGKATVPVRPTY